MRHKYHVHTGTHTIKVNLITEGRANHGTRTDFSALAANVNNNNNNTREVHLQASTKGFMGGGWEGGGLVLCV